MIPLLAMPTQADVDAGRITQVGWVCSRCHIRLELDP
jgi:hypothetical protein